MRMPSRGSRRRVPATDGAGALLAQGLEAGEAAAAAAYLHGISARYAAGGAGGHPGGEAPIGAGDVIGALPEAIRAVSGA